MENCFSINNPSYLLINLITEITDSKLDEYVNKIHFDVGFTII